MRQPPVGLGLEAENLCKDQYMAEAHILPGSDVAQIAFLLCGCRVSPEAAPVLSAAL